MTRSATPVFNDYDGREVSTWWIFAVFVALIMVLFITTATTRGHVSDEAGDKSKYT